jgi:hypothetical protein
MMISQIPKMERGGNRYRYIGDTMPALGLTYLLTGDRRYVESAQTWISALLKVRDWSGSGNLGRSSWVMGCALIYDWLYNVLDPNIREAMRKKLIAECSIIKETGVYWRALSNHLLIETSALGICSLSLGENSEETKPFMDQADKWVNYIIQHAPRDGSWGEGIQYWQYGLGYFIRFLEASKTSGHHDYYQEYDWLKKNGYFPLYFSLPGHSTNFVNFSDSHIFLGDVKNTEEYVAAFLLYFPAAIYGNGYFQQYGKLIQSALPHKFSWLDLISFDTSIQENNIDSLPTLKHFEDNDFLIMRSSWEKDATLVGFHCGPLPGHRNQSDPTREANQGFGPGHGHPDINSFNIYAFGEYLAVDPGYTRHKDTRNHNTVIVNGYGQAGEGKGWLDFLAFESREPAPSILRVESNPIYDYVIGDAGNIYVDEACLEFFRRHVMFLKPDIIIVADDLKAKKESIFEWLLNARDSITQKSETIFEINRNNVRLWIYPILPRQYDAQIQSKDVRIDKKVVEHDVEKNMPSLNLTIRSSTRAQYLVVMCALKDSLSDPPDIQLKGNGLTLKHQDRDWKVEFRNFSELAKPSDPVLILKAPQSSIKSDYCFIRN